MCGIIGILGKNQVAPQLVEALKRLEYRGYDSAGVATVDGEGRLDRRRAVGYMGRMIRALLPYAALAAGSLAAAVAAAGRAPESLTYSAAFVLCAGADEAELTRRAAAIGRELDEMPAEELEELAGLYRDKGLDASRFAPPPRAGDQLSLF